MIHQFQSHPQQPGVFFADIVFVLGHNYQILVMAAGLGALHGNHGVNAAIQPFLTVDFGHPAGNRQRAAGNQHFALVIKILHVSVLQLLGCHIEGPQFAGLSRIPDRLQIMGVVGHNAFIEEIIVADKAAFLKQRLKADEILVGHRIGGNIKHGIRPLGNVKKSIERRG